MSATTIDVMANLRWDRTLLVGHGRRTRMGPVTENEGHLVALAFVEDNRRSLNRDDLLTLDFWDGPNLVRRHDYAVATICPPSVRFLGVNRQPR